ncbi:hypothetical protein F4778DRAFT_411827 [Xylariomycetidae sp. FL2044]|nr:hypothetical protein F4778DRAFT_411827 [Xylariomycetidae sp. FL2044]
MSWTSITKASLLLALLALPSLISAEDSSSANLTVTFYPATDNKASCPGGSAAGALTFTTQTNPPARACFNFTDLFGGTETEHVANTSFWSDVNDRLSWSLGNRAAYDPKATYSIVRYQQGPVPNGGGDDRKAKKGQDLEARQFAVYNGRGCEPTGQPPQPWYAWSCVSSAEGRCDTLPYSVGSFGVIGGGDDDDDDDGKCQDFAYEGSGLPHFGGLRGTVGALVSVAAVLFVLG